MRRSFLLAAMALTLLVSGAGAQDKETRIQGSGNVITRDVAVQSFDELSIGGVFSVVLKQGSKEEVKIEAEDNLQELFEVKNDGSKLSVNMKKNTHFDSKKKMKVYITFRKLKTMNLKTVGNVSSDQQLSFDDLDLNNKSVGNVDLKLTASNVSVENKSVGNLKLQGKADKVMINNNSVGSIEAADFVVQHMEIDNKGVGGAEVNAAKELKVKDSFMGKVTNKGSGTVKKMNPVKI